MRVLSKWSFQQKRHDMSSDALMNTYGDRALTRVKGKGSWVTDDRGNPKVQQGFTPLVEGFVRAPFGEADAVAVMVEAIQGGGGRSTTGSRQLQSICKRI